VGQTAILLVDHLRAVPYLVHGGRKYPIEVWPDISGENLTIVASNVMGTPCSIHNSTRFPVQTDDEVLNATTEELRLEAMKLDALQKEDEIRAKPIVVPTLQQVFRQAPP
jgi:hypothetical protein